MLQTNYPTRNLKNVANHKMVCYIGGLVIVNIIKSLKIK